MADLKETQVQSTIAQKVLYDLNLYLIIKDERFPWLVRLVGSSNTFFRFYPPTKHQITHLPPVM
jgi:hypothetical protein